jgi:hypothetical protein
MAARRLVALLIALLVISSIATALAPPPSNNDETDSTSTTTTGPETDPEAPEAGVVEAVIDSAAEKTTQIEAAVGDQLALVVRADTTSEVEIPGLGLYETAAPGAPALFDVVLREEGALEVTVGGKPAGEILVGKVAAGPAGAKQSAEPRDEKQPEDEPKARDREGSGSAIAA